MKKKSYAAVLMSTIVMSVSLCGCGVEEHSSADDQNSTTGSTESVAWVTKEEVAADGMGDWNYGVPAEDFHVENWNTEEYDSIRESGLQSVRNQPLSTFSVDVDTASYSNLRRMIEDGYSLDILKMVLTALFSYFCFYFYFHHLKFFQTLLILLLTEFLHKRFVLQKIKPAA